MTGTRAVVADDSGFMRRVITDALEAGGVEVVGEARNGREAVERVLDTEPDVVTMDVEMPGMDGLEAVTAIMERRPTPILMLSAHTDEDAAVTFEALDRGAVDFFRKPGGEVSLEVAGLEDQLAEVVASVAGADVAAPSTDEPAAGGATEDAAASDAGPDVGGRGSAATDDAGRAATLLVGSSTGGPKEVEALLGALPRSAGLRIVVVQHMPDGFTERFAGRVDDRSEYDVREAADGDRVGPGEAVVAAGDRHLRIVGDEDGALEVACTDEAPVNSVRPSVDVAMQSAAEVVEGPLVGVVLTGMGEDGAEGVRALDAAGGRVIAQDEATSAVYGMPRRAVETGCVDAVLPAEEIPGGVVDAISREVP